MTPHDKQFDVEGTGSTFFVMQDGKAVMGPFYNRWRAEDVRDELARKARLRKRPCLTCGAEFMSEGAHNRMCDRCRAGATGFNEVA